MADARSPSLLDWGADPSFFGAPTIFSTRNPGRGPRFIPTIAKG
jgi:hypothetical protein